MFTGIVTDLGTVREILPGAVTRLRIETAYDAKEIALGASVSCGGCCLSVVEKGASWEALGRTPPHWRVNLRRMLQALARG